MVDVVYMSRSASASEIRKYKYSDSSCAKNSRLKIGCNSMPEIVIYLVLSIAGRWLKGQGA